WRTLERLRRSGDRPGRNRRRFARRENRYAVVRRKAFRTFGPRGRHVTRSGTQQNVERLTLALIHELQRDRRARELLAVDDLRLSDARPFLKDLAQGGIRRDDRHTAVLHRQLQVLPLGRGGQRYAEC